MHNDSLTASDSLKFQFATDGEGNYGFLKGDDTFVPFKSADLKFYGNVTFKNSGSSTTSVNQTITLPNGDKPSIVVFSDDSSHVGFCANDGSQVTLSYCAATTDFNEYTLTARLASGQSISCKVYYV